MPIGQQRKPHPSIMEACELHLSDSERDENRRVLPYFAVYNAHFFA